MTFVSVGNATQPFLRLLNAILTIAPRLPQPVIVQHGNCSFTASNCICKPFIQMDEFHELVKEAELVIMHAGAGSIIHAIRAGKIPVVMPRRKKYAEHIDDHQRELANAFEQLGKVVLVDEPDDLMDAVVNTLMRQSNPTNSHQVNPMVYMVETVLRSYAERLRSTRWTPAKDSR